MMMTLNICLTKEQNFQEFFQVTISTPEEWEDIGGSILVTNSITWHIHTYGSKPGTQTGAWCARIVHKIQQSKENLQLHGLSIRSACHAIKLCVREKIKILNTYR